MNLPLEFLLYPLLSILIYSRSLKGPMFFDDFAIQPAVDAFTQHKWKSYRPLTILSHWLLRQWPATIRGERCLNVWLHAGMGIIVARIAAELGAPQPLLVGALCVVHPFAVNSVAYMAARASILSALFGMCGVLAILSGYPLLCLPLLVLSVLSKEEGIAFTLLYLVLGVWWMAFVVLAVLIWSVKPVYRVVDGKKAGFNRWQEYTRSNGDDIMKSIGLPASLPRKQHFIVVLTETLDHIQFWIFGFFRSPYHGSGIGLPNLSKVLAAGIVAFVLTVAARVFPVEIAVLLLGPWLVYLVIPVPDQLAEYRNYAMVAGFVLVLGAIMPTWLIVTVGVFFAAESFRSAAVWSSEVNLWKYAILHHTGETSRAHQEVGAFMKLRGGEPFTPPWYQAVKESKPWLEKALQLNPALAPAAENLAWAYAIEGNPEDGLKVFRRALELTPQYLHGPRVLAGLTNELGLKAFKAGKVPEARSTFGEALKLHDIPPYRYNLAVTMKVMGENAESEFRKLPPQLPYSQNMIHPQVMQT